MSFGKETYIKDGRKEMEMEKFVTMELDEML